MSKLTIIQLLNKIANGKEVPKKIRIEHWCYNFEWIEHDENYYDKHQDIDLMSCLSMSTEELNYEIEIIEEDKKIEKLDTWFSMENVQNNGISKIDFMIKYANYNFETYFNKINEIIDILNKGDNND